MEAIEPSKTKLHLSIHELVTIVSVVVSITMAFLFLRADVNSLSKDLVTVHETAERLEAEQKEIRKKQDEIKHTVDLLYVESVKANIRNNPENFQGPLQPYMRVKPRQ